MALIHKVPRKALHKIHHKGQNIIIRNKNMKQMVMIQKLKI